MKKLVQKDHILSKRKLIIGLGVVVIITAIIGSFPINKDLPNTGDFFNDQVPYSVDGPFKVGLRRLEIDSDTPIYLMVWYPGLNADARNQGSYQYELKMKKPLGRISIASYKSYAENNASFDPSMAPYPLVILSPGFSLGSATYGWLAEHLASYGFIVVSPDHTEKLNSNNDLWRALISRPKEISRVIDLFNELAGDGEILDGMVNPDTIALIGHSFGGYTALATAGARIDTRTFQANCAEAIASKAPGYWLCEKLLQNITEMADLAGLDTVPEGYWPSLSDERVDVIVSMAGNAFLFSPESLAEISIPVMAIGGTADNDSPYMWGTYPTYQYSSSTSKVRIALEDAEHMIFTGVCEKIPWYVKIFSKEFCSDKTWDRKNMHRIIKHFATTFLLTELKNDPEADAFLTQKHVDIQGIDYQIEKQN